MAVDGVTLMRKPPLYKRLAHSAFGGEASAVFRGMAVLATGSGLAKVVGLVSMPILARLYTPEDFGIMAVFLALIAILSPFLTLRYVLALPLPRTDAAAINIFALCLALSAVMGAVMTLLLGLFAAPLLKFLSMEVLAPWWWLIVIGLLTAGANDVLTQWATRKRNYRIIARTSVLKSLGGNAVKLGMGVSVAGPLGLLLGALIADNGGLATFLRHYTGALRASWRHVRLRRMRALGQRYISFPLYRVPSQFLLSFAMQSPVFFIAGYYGAFDAGQFALALTVIALPITLVAKSAGSAFLGEASRLASIDHKSLQAVTKDVIRKTAILSIIPSAILLFFGEPLFVLVFGEQWATAGVFASYLSIYLFFHFISHPIQHLFQILGRNDLYLQQVLRRAIMVALLFVGCIYFEVSATNTILIYSVAMSVHYTIVSTTVLRLAGKFSGSKHARGAG